MKKLLIATLLALSFPASAQHIGTLPPNADGRLYYSWDSDKFTVLHSWVGAAHESGFGARVGYSQYKQKINETDTTRSTWDNSGLIGGPVNLAWHNYGSEDGRDTYQVQFGAESNVFQLTYVNVGENHDFQGAIGVRKTDYRVTATKDSDIKTVDVDLLLSRTIDPSVLTLRTITTSTHKTTHEEIEGRGDYNTLVANADLKLVMTDRLTIGAAIATDVVESPASIMENVRQVYTAADADYLITENLNFNVIAGVVSFIGEPDANNKRPFIRTNTVWTFLPEHGVSVNFRTRNQYDTDSGSAYYYSPERLARQSVGLNIRKPYDGLVYTAGVEYGSEQATDAAGTKDVHPVYGWQLGIQTSPGRKTGVTYGVSLVGSNAAGIGNATGGGANYYWYGLNSWIKVPLQ